MNTLNTSGKTSITIDGSILLGGEYSHINKDLIISTDSDTTVVKDYFVNLPTLVSPQGATLTPNLVSSLSAYQSNKFVAFEDPKAIGEITVTDGPIVITRVGQKIELQQGDFIYLNDFVDVGQNTVGITFKDDTALSLEPGAKMVVDEFYYDPEANQGGMNADVIGGSFSFVSGNIAKVGNDAMTVSTPVLTIGVRGTQVAGRANQEGEDNEIVLLPNADGTVGEISIKNDSGEVILTEAYQASTITSSIMPPTVPVILPKEIVLKKYAKTISTTRKTEKIKEVERETEEATKEKEQAESEKEQLEEEAEELEEEAEQLEEEKEQLEEEAEQLEEEKEQLEEKAEELKEEIAELEEKLENADADEIEEIQEELAEAEQEIEEVEEQVEEVVKEEKVIEQKVEQVEEKVEEVKQEVQQIEQKVEFVEEQIVKVEEKFDAIVEEFEVFQEEFVQEFQDFIPEEEIEQFMEEAPLEIIEEFQEKIIEKLENDGVELKENIEEEPEDIFAEENVKEKLEEIDEKQEELIEKADELMEKDMQLQEDAKALEEEAKALEEEAKALEEEAEEAYANNDQEAIEEIEEKFQQIDEERQQIDKGFQEIDEQYEELDENFEELNNEFFAMDEELQEVFQDGPMVVRVPEDGPGFNEDNDVFNVPEDQQIDVNVEEFLAEEKEKAMQNNEFAVEADNFFNDQEVQEALPDNIDDNVQDMMIIGAGNLDEYFVGAGAGIETPEDFYAEDPMEDFYNIVDNNEELYYAEQDAQDWMDDLIEDLAAENNINVAPWLDMPNDVTVNEADAKTSGTVVGYVYGSDANGDPLTFSIFDDPTGALSISGNTITWDGTFGNINQDTTYSVLLKVQDPYGASDIDSWQITVENNHSPVISSTSAVSLAEDVSTGTTVATISASDAESETITYSITAGNTGNAFTINSSTGVITTAAALDYETTTSYNLTITATDAFGNATTTTQTVNVTDVNEVVIANDPAGWVTAGDGSAGAYQKTIAYAGPGNTGRDYASALGHQGLDFNGAIASNFNSYDVIWYLNQSNSGFQNSVFYNDTRFTDWLNNGGVFIMHDRYVNDSQLDNNLPGHNGNVTTTRSFVMNGNQSSSYQIVDESTSNLLKYGPGGIMVDDTSSFGTDTSGDHSGNTWQGTFNIGGGNGTNHGYMTNLDSDVLGLATNNTTTQYVDAVWEYGSGAVYYSTTPLDHYIGAAPADNDAWDAYALNSLHYATSLIFDGYSQINGTTNSDTIYATAGDDVIYAGNSSDTIWGGQGDDVFKYDATTESNSVTVDTILDFNKDEDSIDISAITSGASISRTLTGGTRFKLDIDNNGSYDMEFELTGYTGTADDISVTV